MAVTSGGFSFVGFQLFVLLIMKGWRVYPTEMLAATVIGSLLAWAVFPKSVGKCVQIGVITGLVVGYVLIILLEKKI